jgi:phenylalanyl-tRNA synthetase beta chain
VQDVVAQLSRHTVALTSLEGRAPQMLHPYACAAVQVDGVEVGWLGSVHPDVLSKLKVEGEVFAFSLDASRLLALRQSLAPMAPIPRYPASLRDFALAMDAKTTYAQVEAALSSLGDKRLVGFQLFDVYEGEQLGEGRKSMAIKVTLRDAEGTLSEEVLTSLQAKIVAHLEQTLDAEQR